jgi:hypothetical protein
MVVASSAPASTTQLASVARHPLTSTGLSNDQPSRVNDPTVGRSSRPLGPTRHYRGQQTLANGSESQDPRRPSGILGRLHRGRRRRRLMPRVGGEGGGERERDCPRRPRLFEPNLRRGRGDAGAALLLGATGGLYF